MKYGFIQGSRCFWIMEWMDISKCFYFFRIIFICLSWFYTYFVEIHWLLPFQFFVSKLMENYICLIRSVIVRAKKWNFSLKLTLTLKSLFKKSHQELTAMIAKGRIQIVFLSEFMRNIDIKSALILLYIHTNKTKIFSLIHI